MRLGDPTPAEQRQITSSRAKPATVKVANLPCPNGHSDIECIDPKWLCVPCGQRFDKWASVERHIDKEHGGGRIQFLLPGDS
jgi:hypothetical protein